jgi:hypothetical protein
MTNFDTCEKYRMDRTGQFSEETGIEGTELRSCRIRKPKFGLLQF